VFLSGTVDPRLCEQFRLWSGEEWLAARTERYTVCCDSDTADVYLLRTGSKAPEAKLRTHAEVDAAEDSMPVSPTKRARLVESSNLSPRAQTALTAVAAVLVAASWAATVGTVAVRAARG
jgi:hypothetical protein